MKNAIAPVLLIGGLILLTGGRTALPRSTSHGRHPGSLKADARQLKSTIVSPTLDAPLSGSKNVLWCGTFQLAWNEACDLAGKDLRVEPPHPMVDALNRKTFIRQDLDDASCVALAGLVKDDIYGRIRRTLARKFAAGAQPELGAPGRQPHRPDDLVAYAYLLKNLEFETPFENLEHAFRFAGKKVASFGMVHGAGAERGHNSMTPAKMARQILILNYRGSNDFIIELKTKASGDRLLLAKIESAPTLAETIASVQARIASAKATTATPRVVFVAPKLNFDITRNYDELVGRRVLHHNPQLADDLVLVSAVQKTRFQLDEEGALLRSESQIIGGCAAPPRPNFLLVFDHPFLILMQRADSTTPYFALWVADTELLVPW